MTGPYAGVGTALLDVGTSTIGQDAPAASAVPDWVKTSAGWWAAGDIDDAAFLQSIGYLIREGLISVEYESGQGGQGGSVPDWVKTSAGWWAAGDIDDAAFLQSIGYLIREGILVVD